eukprot:gnl/MRDRNA2_/MRDRNA2_84999_c0_seq2.p1 gnl/MRDRNA2_/MRDRNA2_84999_c0~~gnl/MRDRNA2_/MRDRNA2_84999_c0_seq2.p1  ORF type:complete len:945 (+),score=168.92 gnl/MRDRNA2_/MRDRNA2_84999_c0_seq2:159-2993(+)
MSKRLSTGSIDVQSNPSEDDVVDEFPDLPMRKTASNRPWARNTFLQQRTGTAGALSVPCEAGSEGHQQDDTEVRGSKTAVRSRTVDTGNTTDELETDRTMNLKLLPSTHPEYWEAVDVSNYLQRRGIPGKLYSVFEDSDSLINGLLCRSLEDQDLESMGVDNIFHRRRILREITYLFDNWPSCCEGWLDTPIPAVTRPHSARSWKQRKRVPWPPPPPRVRPASAPSKGRPNNYVLWQRRQEEERRLYHQSLQRAMDHRVTQAQQLKIMEESSELGALRDLFKKNTQKSASEHRSSALFRRVSVADPDLPHGEEQKDEAEGSHENKGGAPNVKQQLLLVRQKAQEEMNALVPGMSNSPTPHGGRVSSPTSKSKRLNKSLSQRRTGKKQPSQFQKRESKADSLKKMSRMILDASPEDEAEMQEAFERYATDGLISRRDLWQTLADMGLSAKNRTGKQLVNQCFEATWAIFNEGDNDAAKPENAMVSFYFAVVHVKDVRRALHDQMRRDMWDHFQKADMDHSGKLDLDEVLTALETFELCPRDQAELSDLLLVINDIDRDQNGIDFEEFVELAGRVRGHLNQERRRQQRMIAEQAGLDDKIFSVLRTDILDLARAFKDYDTDGSGSLNGPEITPLLLDIGLAPQNSAQRMQFQATLLEHLGPNGQMQLPEFFRLCYSQRTIFEQDWKERTQALFRSCDRDNSNSLEASEVGQVLVKLGLQPRNKAEQKEIADIVEEADIDGSGSIDFGEFETIVHRVDTKLRSMQRDRDAEFAAALGFSKERFQELLETYQGLEDHYSTGEADGFDITGLRQLVNKLRKSLSSDALRNLFQQLDEDRVGCLGMFQFLQFMWITENDAFDLKTGIITQDPPVKPSRQDKQSKNPLKANYDKQKHMSADRARSQRVLGYGATIIDQKGDKYRSQDSDRSPSKGAMVNIGAFIDSKMGGN